MESGRYQHFKGGIYDGKGKPKGNCDADLALQLNLAKKIR